MKVSVVIPAFNEEVMIVDVIQRIQKTNMAAEIIVVDDCSSDKTADFAEAAGAMVIRQPYNRGNGAAIKAGGRRAKSEWIVFLDSDGQHPPEEISRLLSFTDRYDMVVGSRTAKSKVSRFRSLGNFFLIHFAQFLSGEEILDLTSGFRAVKRSVFMQFIHLFPNRYSYPTTITLACLRSGFFVKFVPVDSITHRKAGKSNIRPWRDGLKFLDIMIRITMLFNPQKIFTCIGGALLMGGFCMGAFQFVTRGGLMGASLILILSGLFTFLIGLVAQQVSNIRLELLRKHDSEN